MVRSLFKRPNWLTLRKRGYGGPQMRRLNRIILPKYDEGFTSAKTKKTRGAQLNRVRNSNHSKLGMGMRVRWWGPLVYVNAFHNLRTWRSKLYAPDDEYQLVLDTLIPLGRKNSWVVGSKFVKFPHQNLNKLHNQLECPYYQDQSYIMSKSLSLMMHQLNFL